jgi:hypothetical protein
VPWSELERRHADVILEALGLSSIRKLIDCPEVRQMDLRMLMTEKRDLASPEPEPWGIDAQPLEGLSITECWSATRAAGEFTNLFTYLTSP